MKTIEGYDVKIFTDNIEENALEQIKELLSMDVFSDKKILICSYLCAPAYRARCPPRTQKSAAVQSQPPSPPHTRSLHTGAYAVRTGSSPAPYPPAATASTHTAPADAHAADTRRRCTAQAAGSRPPPGPPALSDP